MSLAIKIEALFAAMQPHDLDELTPAQRRRFADTLRHWWRVAEQPPAVTKGGVLALLHSGDRQP